MNIIECGTNFGVLEKWILTYYTKDKPTKMGRVREVIDFSFTDKTLFYRTYTATGTIDIATLNYLSIRPETIK